jgi:hypothetical protein
MRLLLKIHTVIGINFEAFTGVIVQRAASPWSRRLIAGYKSFGGICCPNLEGVNKYGDDAIITYLQITRKVVTAVQVRG